MVDYVWEGRVSFKRLEKSLELNFKGFIVRRDNWNFVIDAQQLVHGNLGCSYGVLHGEYGILWDFDELTDESKVLGTPGDRQWSITDKPRHEHAGDEWHSAGDAVG